MGYVDRFIRNINNGYREGTLLRNLVPGDIIWAKRYSKEEIRNNINLEHQESPFVVIYKNDHNTVFCLDCSSKEKTLAQNIIKLKKDNYQNILYRDTYIKLKPDVEMTSFRYIRKIGTLQFDDFNLLKKKLFLYLTDKNIEKQFNFSKEELDYILDFGDIIKDDNEKYYLISNNNKRTKKIYGYPLVVENENPEITINNIGFNIRYDRKLQLKIRKFTLLAIYHKFPSYNDEPKRIGYFKPKIGDLINLNDKLYLIHGRIKEFHVALLVSESAKFNTKKNKYAINISNKLYWTTFEFFLINKTYEYNIISRCNEFEICEYLYKMKRLNITPNISENSLIQITDPSSINIDYIQNDIRIYLKQMGFTFEEIAGILVGIKEPTSIIKFRDYLTKNYNEKNKNIIKCIAKQLMFFGDYNSNIYLTEGDIIISKADNDPVFKNGTITPYIVLQIDKEQEKIYCVTATDKISKIKGKTILKISMNGINELYVKPNIPIEIKKDNYIETINNITDNELNELKKRIFIYLYFNEDLNVKFKKEWLKYTNSLYDIISYNNYYYLIFFEDFNYFYAYPVSQSSSNRPYFKINNIGYEPQMKNYIKLKKDLIYDVVHILKKDRLALIKNSSKWKKETIAVPQTYNTSIAKRGDIFQYNNIFYLIYGEYKKYFLIYKIFVSNNKDIQIYGKNRNYNTNYECYLISKNTELAILDYVEQEEINKINNDKKLREKPNLISNVPIDNINSKTIELNSEQLQLIEKLKHYKFSEKQIIGTLIGINNKFTISEILDFIIKSSYNSDLTKEEIKEKIKKLIRNED